MCYQILPTELRLKFRSTRYSTRQQTLNSQTQDSLRLSLNAVGHVRFVKGNHKERCKSRCCTKLQREIRVSEKCFLCRSLVFCKTCSKCQTCCSKSACRGKTSKFLANLAGSGCRSESC